MKIRNIFPLIIAVALPCLALAQTPTAQTRAALFTQNDASITANGRGLITGPLLNALLGRMTASMGTLLDNNTWIGAQTFSGGAAIPFTQSGTGAVASTVDAKLKQFVNITDFGAKCDGLTDDTSSITAAAAAALGRGATLQFPSGTCVVPGTLVMGMSSEWAGVNYQSTVLKTTSATLDLIQAPNGYATIRDMQFQSSVPRTGGSFINSTAGYFQARNIFMSGAYYGLTLGAGSSSTLIDNYVSLNTVALNGIDLVINACINCGFHNLNMFNAPTARPLAHIQINNSGDLHFFDANLSQAINQVYIAPGNGQSVSSVKFIGGYLDEAGQNGAAIVPTGTGSVDKVLFQGTWFKNAAPVTLGSAAAVANLNIAASGAAYVDTVQCVACEFYGPGITATTGASPTTLGVKAYGANIYALQIIGGITGANLTGVDINGVNSLQIADLRCGTAKYIAPPSYCIGLAGTIDTASIHDVHNSKSGTPLNNTATITTSNIHNNY